MDNFQI